MSNGCCVATSERPRTPIRSGTTVDGTVGGEELANPTPPEARPYSWICTPKAASAPATVVDTGNVRSFELTCPGVSPREVSVEATSVTVLAAAPNKGPNWPLARK
jgi:hypothetical protein